MSDAPGEVLAETLEIEDRGEDRFVARLESHWGSALPGDLLARATLAAATRSGQAPSAVHAVFLGALTPDVELSLALEPFGPGRTRVRVAAAGTAIAEVLLRFDSGGEGISYQSAGLEPGLPAPEDLPSETEVAASEGWEPYAVGPIESRRIGAQSPVKEHEPAVWLGWLRPRAPLPDDAALQAAALSYLSEYRSHWAVERRLGSAFQQTRITLLDHACFVHRTEPWDDWRLVRTSSEVGAEGRCLSRREIHSRGGALIASACWEATARPA